MTLNEVKQKIYSLCIKLDLDTSSKLLPMFSEDAHIFSEGASIYVENSKCYYIIMERGQINKQYVSENLDNILYPVFKDITFSLACKYELELRNKQANSRKKIWQIQLELLEKLDKCYAVTCKEEINSLLEIAKNKYNK